MDAIRDIVKKVIGGISSTGQQEQKDIQDLWKKILSEKEKKHARISGLKGGTLMVNVDSSAWLYQFNLKKGKILKDIQERGHAIKGVYFKIGKTK